MKLVFVLSVLFGFCFGEMMEIVRVTDGDTMVFLSGRGEVKCRVLGMDSPEKYSSEKMQKDAAKIGVSVEELTIAGELSTVYANTFFSRHGQMYDVDFTEQDRYGRNLCVITAQSGEIYNVEAVRAGYAVVYRRGKYTKDKKLAHAINKAQGEAATSKSGLWGTHYDIMYSMSR